MNDGAATDGLLDSFPAVTQVVCIIGSMDSFFLSVVELGMLAAALSLGGLDPKV